MKTYLLTSSRFTGHIVFKYNLNSGLDAFEINAELSEVQRAWLYNNFPLIYEDLVFLASGKNSTMKVTYVPEDLSFERFWKSYAYKVGKMDRARKLWELLKEDDKVKALNYLTKYDLFLDKTGTNKLYPETYLNQKRWNNE